MKSFYYEFDVGCNIDKAWTFYTDIRHLEVISPKNINLKLIESTDRVLKKGSVVCFEGKIILSANWCSRISLLQEYEYIDEMVCNGNQRSPFRIWRHKHKFEIIESHKTRVVDLIEFELPYGVLGKVLEIYIIYKLKCIFRYREQTTKECLT